MVEVLPDDPSGMSLRVLGHKERLDIREFVFPPISSVNDGRGC
jgi:hypothetical protein